MTENSFQDLLTLSKQACDQVYRVSEIRIKNSLDTYLFLQKLLNSASGSNEKHISELKKLYEAGSIMNRYNTDYEIGMINKQIEDKKKKLLEDLEQDHDLSGTCRSSSNPINDPR